MYLSGHMPGVTQQVTGPTAWPTQGLWGKPPALSSCRISRPAALTSEAAPTSSSAVTT